MRLPPPRSSPAVPVAERTVIQTMKVNRRTTAASDPAMMPM
jgi:hypothetical protein